MILRDTIQWDHAGTVTALPAQVSTSGAVLQLDGATYYGTQAVTIIHRTLPPGGVDELSDRITWHGVRLRLEGPPMPRMRGGTVHHYTTRCTTT